MLAVWAFCIVLFTILPFDLVDRTVTLYGFGVLILYLSYFCFGAILESYWFQPVRMRPDIGVDFTTTDQILKCAALIAITAFLWDLIGKDLLNLSASFLERSSRAQALLYGEQSKSSLAFKIGFLFYPAGFTYMVREIGFEEKIRPLQVIVFGILPVFLATLSMGGRMPILYGLLLIVLSCNIRKILNRRLIKSRRISFGWKYLLIIKIGIGILFVAALIYFIQVFIVRAELNGGVRTMFDIAAKTWGIGFTGFRANYMFAMLGNELTYLIFVFSWYLTQGLLISNYIFSGYNGDMLWGVYGIDLLTALMRRIDGQFVAQGFSQLLSLKVYGFFPSAFGSLFVDFQFFGLLPTMLWGWLAALVYHKNTEAIDHRWLLFSPFVFLGIVFSIINTPLGFSNGLMTHFWLVIAFYFSRRVKAGIASINKRVL